MKSVFFFSLMTLTTFAWSAHGWKVVAVTTNGCKEKVEVLAKEGENFVYVNEGDVKTKLFSEDGSTYSEQNGKAVTFTNTADKTLSPADSRYTFVQPSMVDGNPAKLQVATNGLKTNCKMNLK